MTPSYASFGTRFIAVLIDGMILIIPAFILGVATHGLLSIVLYFAYKVLFEASNAQATPGKRSMNLMVTGLDGQKLDVKSASIRAVVSFLSSSCLFIGHFVALFTDKHQAAHDLMAESVVIQGDTNAPLIESWLETARDVFAKSKSV